MSIREYREIAAGERWPDGETFNRICELYGRPQTFVGSDDALARRPTSPD